MVAGAWAACLAAALGILAWVAAQEEFDGWSTEDDQRYRVACEEAAS
jgi:hypothetical protein